MWERLGVADGTSTYRLASWSEFFDFLEAEVFSSAGYGKRSYIWRGQREADWSLSTTLDRQLAAQGLAGLASSELERLSLDHLERFKYAARGRRGPAPASLSENEWWALGQHFGLATPLLDWTRAPFAALYFAFEQASLKEDGFRAIYALDEYAVEAQGRAIYHGPSIEAGRIPIVEIVDPMSDENQRLVSQGGCFSRAPIGTALEQWVSRAFEGSAEATLIRIEVPDKNRLSCLQALNRMNISHLSLFPDLGGATRATNLQLESLQLSGRKHA